MPKSDSKAIRQAAQKLDRALGKLERKLAQFHDKAENLKVMRSENTALKRDLAKLERELKAAHKREGEFAALADEASQELDVAIQAVRQAAGG